MCPVSGYRGRPVGWLTVAALTTGPIPSRQFWLCRDSECAVVYFGSAGILIEADELHVRAGFKQGSDSLVCYCFGHRRADIERQLAAGGSATLLESIKAKVAAGNCACEVRNPSGRCCLGEVQEAVRELQRNRK